MSEHNHGGTTPAEVEQKKEPETTIEWWRDRPTLAPSVRIARAICWLLAWVAFLVAVVYVQVKVG